MTRQSVRLAALDRRLSERDRGLVQEVVRLRFITAGQLERLAFHAIAEPVTRARRTRRQLARLVDLGLLSRLERRVGGVRAGSSGFVYGATPEARRLDAWLRGETITRVQATHEPGLTFLAHGVAGSELFLRLLKADRAGQLELLEHQAEPACWRQFVGASGGLRHLRPDAFVRLGVGAWEQLAFVEIDRGTEGSTAIARKLECYAAYWASGAEQHQRDVFPRVVWLTTTARREHQLRTQLDGLPATTQTLFAVAAFEQVVNLLCDATDDNTVDQTPSAGGTA
jgi:hypothetical protein